MKKIIKASGILSIALALSVFLASCGNNVVPDKEFKIRIFSNNTEICNVTFDTKNDKFTTSKITSRIKENNNQICKVEGNINTGFKITLEPTTNEDNSKTIE